MKKSVDFLRRQNNENEKIISSENDIIYTDMVCYLRVSKLTDRQQEEVRSDLIGMIGESQERNESIEDLIGEDYKEFCDNIINSIPEDSKTKIFEWISLFIYCALIMMTIDILPEIIANLVKYHQIGEYKLTYGFIFGSIVAPIIAVWVVDIIGKSSFKEEKETFKGKRFLIGAMVGVGFYILVLIKRFLKAYTIFAISSKIVLIILALVWVIILTKYTTNRIKFRRFSSN